MQFPQYVSSVPSEVKNVSCMIGRYFQVGHLQLNAGCWGDLPPNVAASATAFKGFFSQC